MVLPNKGVTEKFPRKPSSLKFSLKILNSLSTSLTFTLSPLVSNIYTVAKSLNE